MISLAGKAALITGGSRGIGAATVRLFAQAGADVVFNYNKSKDAATQLEGEAKRHGTRVESMKADLSKMADAKRLVEFAKERLGRIDILVANAGVWNEQDAPIEKMTEREWDDMMRINVKSVYSVIHYTVPHMQAQKGGKIVAISSTAGQRGEANHTHYGASKGAIISFGEGFGIGTGAAEHSGELRGAGMGGYGHVGVRAADEERIEGRAGADSGEARGHGGRNCRADTFCGVRSGNLCGGRGNQR
jgi:3-oxoacyl-[acyl-carrier protein] reductase